MAADELASTYRARASTLRIGLALGGFSLTFCIARAVGIFRIMAQMERGGELLRYAQPIRGVLTGMAPMFACITWLKGAFRAQRGSAIIRLLFDTGWRRCWR
jgi:hypothetical protein